MPKTKTLVEKLNGMARAHLDFLVEPAQQDAAKEIQMKATSAGSKRSAGWTPRPRRPSRRRAAQLAQMEQDGQGAENLEAQRNAMEQFEE